MNRYHFPEIELENIENYQMPFAIYQFLDRRVVTIALSAGFRELFGYKDKALAYYEMDNDMYKDTHPDDVARIADAAIKFATEENGKFDVIYRSKDPNGSGYNIIHAQGAHSYTPTGERTAQVWYTNEGSYSEESDNAEATLTNLLKNALYEESFIKASYYDHLTGLPSMTHFFELATLQRNAIIDEGEKPALMFMDFSGMKYFNHKYGFAEGDKLLRAFSRLLSEYFGNDNCSHIGQDHFAVIAKSDMLEDLLKSLFKDCANINGGCSLPLHVGIYLHWLEGVNASMACDRAKFACDTLKSEYSSSYSYYDMSMKDTEEKQQYIISNIDRAIKEEWITVYYQPIVRGVNQRVCDEEALARWIDPEKGFMSPADFIPTLEEHRLIYKLDLYIVERVLKKIRQLERAGLHIVPQSVNLSRSDFDTCDIVDEIRRRVDEAGIKRSFISIEITESTIGKDFEFIKAQIERFKSLGFPVWMDDFGSGYSSLDVLQDIKFDLIKFDMRFMQKFNQGDQGKIILTEMIKMATALGIDTICEGVETQEQMHFLQEAGCSKLQGYFFDRPIPVEKILEKYEKGLQIGFEDPNESQYYEAVGRVNLYDLSVIAQNNLNGFGNIFNTLPMAVVEINKEQVRFARTNPSYREFMKRHFVFIVNNKPESFHDKPEAVASPFMRALIESCKDSSYKLFVDERMPSNAVVHSCLRRLAVNPVTGTVAVAVAVLSISDTEQGISYANIARALSADYFNIFYVDITNDTFFEYTSDIGEENLTMERRSENFFEKARADALKYLYSEDRDTFVEAFVKENILRQIEKHGTFTVTYRLMKGNKPFYVNMKATSIQDDPNHIIIGVSDIDPQMKQQELLEKAHWNEITFSRIMALSGNCLCMYTVDIESKEYTEYTAVKEYKTLGLEEAGRDFFEGAVKNSVKVIYKDDLPLIRERLTKDNVLQTIKDNGVFTMQYRIVINDRQIPATMRAVLVREDNADKLIVGVYKKENQD